MLNKFYVSICAGSPPMNGFTSPWLPATSTSGHNVNGNRRSSIIRSTISNPLTVPLFTSYMLTNVGTSVSFWATRCCRQ